jgi:cellulose synthase/poly-beta-1,6-N-acetylglucosamine synthase-like glycosyltransferase
MSWVLVAALAVLAGHTAVNVRLLRRPSGTPAGPVRTRVSVLLPVRDEAHRIGPCLAALSTLESEPEVILLDDGSSDGTGELARGLGLRVVPGRPLPPGWLGKPHACQQLADLSTADVLVFVDADVVLSPTAIIGALSVLDGLDLVTPYPRIVAEGLGQRLVQPLLQWSWLTFLPLRAMERSRRPSLAAAGGQFLVVRRAAYERAGGHAAVRRSVLEDIDLARAVKRAGGRVGIADGSALATCRMYSSWAQLREGYTKSLWASFGSPLGAVFVGALLMLLYVAPIPVAWASGSLAAGVLAYALGVLGRVLAARATGGRAWPDALAHPISILVLAYLVARSFALRRRVVWKGRRLFPGEGG